jgi:hypothetical protein
MRIGFTINIGNYQTLRVDSSDLPSYEMCMKEVIGGDEAMTTHRHKPSSSISPQLPPDKLNVRTGESGLVVVYICPECASNHEITYISFSHGFGIEKTLIDGVKADLVMFPPSRLRKCSDCRKKVRHAWKLEVKA